MSIKSDNVFIIVVWEGLFQYFQQNEKLSLIFMISWS